MRVTCAVSAMLVCLACAAADDVQTLNIPDIVIHEPIPPCRESLRVNRDTPVKLDLSKAQSISFDFLCRNLRPYRYFTIYFKCGTGEYIGHNVTPLQPSGTLEHFAFPISEFGVARLKDASALAKITEMRFSGWRNSAEDALADIVLTNFKISENPLPKKRKVKDPTVAPVPAKSGERRLIWCHRAWGIGKEPGKVSWDEQLAKLKAAGITDILPNFCRAYGCGYKSEVYPTDDYVAKCGDQLDLCLAAGRRHGIKVHAWKCCWNLSRKPNPDLRAKLARENRLQMRFADIKTGVSTVNWLCPTESENIRLETAAMVELAKRGVDGIHFDYIRYLDKETCVCPRCRALFEKRLGHSVADWPHALSSDTALVESWRQFRCDNITAYVKGVVEIVRRDYPKVEISAAIRPSSRLATYSVAQDWERWAKAGWLDFVCTMGYTSSLTLFRESRLDVIKEENCPVKVYPGIGVSLWKFTDGTNPDRFRDQILATREAGFGGFCLFEWTSRTEALLPILAQQRKD